MTEGAPPNRDEPSQDGPTEMVEGTDGELVERLSTGTATLLLVWLIGTGAASALLAAWLFAAVILGQRMGAGELFSSLGLYIAVFGASGPTLLWLTGRAQGHSLGWFLLTAAKMGLAMIGSIVAVIALGALLVGASFGPGFLPLAGAAIGATLVLALLWAVVTWSADRWIARARTVDGEAGASEPD